VKQLHSMNWIKGAIALSSSLAPIAVILTAQPGWASEGAGEQGVEVDERMSGRVDGSEHSTDPSAPPSATTVSEWLAQIEAAIVEITGVRVERSETGLQVILETADGDLSVPTTETAGNALIAEIPNAVLALPEGDEFQQANPVAGIALVSVTDLDDNQVQISITGTDAPPQAQVSTEAGNLVLSVVPGIAQVDDADDAIEIIVTGEQEGYYVPDASVGTRTETPIRDIPQSIQVVPQQVLEDRVITNQLDTIRTVSGITPNTQSNAPGSSTRAISIRGFDNGAIAILFDS